MNENETILPRRRHCPICWQRKTLDNFDGDKRRCKECDDRAKKRAEAKQQAANAPWRP